MSFSIARSRCGALEDPALREEIQSHTGSDAQTTSILRSLERFGLDASIRYFEMTPVARRTTSRVSASASWTVRAVR